MKKSERWEKFLHFMAVEIRIEYKACLYFFAFLFFYCCFLLLQKNYEASILHMAEMIFSTYLMGYIQVYLLGGFDESERFGIREAICAACCTAVYTLLSYLCGWFDRALPVTILFAVFLFFAYFCNYLINKIKREADTKQLNALLTAYKKGEEDEIRN